MKAVIEGRDPVIDEPLDHEAGTVRGPKVKITQGELGPNHMVATMLEPDPPPDPDPSDFPDGWTREIYQTIEKLSSEFNADFAAASFVQLTRLVHGWNQSIATLPPAIGQVQSLLASLLAEQVKTREAIEESNTIALRQINGLIEIHKLLKGQAK